ncbi:MAG: ABC transporter ATP-binding protein [Bordetella sp.]|nr:ABC transporter ATP-binding protein [Bordetella sp.]
MHAEPSTPLVRVRELCVDFRRGWQWRRAVSGVSFDLAAGECVALVGESGSGKSVSARSLLGLNGPDARVSAECLQLEGADLRPLGERQWRTLRGRRVGYILQDALVSLDPLRTIGQELAEAIRATGAVPPDGVRAEALRLLERAGFADGASRLDHHPSQLSGGQRQRALIASAIAGRPPVLIADEPTTALDVSVQQQVLALFRELKRSGVGLILISHDLGVVSQLADRVLVLRAGTVVEAGDTGQILRRPAHPYTRMLLDAVPRFDVPPARQAVDVDACAPLLHAVELRKRFASQPDGAPDTLRGVSLTLNAGRTLGLVGESGSGKTTLARILAGLETPTAGRLEAQPLLAQAPSGRARPIQFVYQDPLSAFDPRHTVERILGQALAMRYPNDSRAQRRGRVVDWLARVGLDESLAGRRPLTLSGGQRQRVAIARALAVEPRLVVMDEPVSALDVSVQQQILALIAQLQASTGAAFLFISHDLGVVRQVSHEVAVMRHGELREHGPTEQVLGRPSDPYTRELIAAIPQLHAVEAATAT